jgi:hypothetical protein
VRDPLSVVSPTTAEIAAALPGDDIVADADVVMDRAFTVDAPPDQTWPWLAQLGKRRAGWYFPRAAERFVPPSRRGLRWLDPAFRPLQVGDVIPDWGGRNASFEVALIDPPRAVVYRSRRGDMNLTWTIVLRPVTAPDPSFGSEATRVQLRLRLGPVRRVWLATSVGDLIDGLTIVGLAAGLGERVRGR